MKMSRRQINDMKECERMGEQGESMDCFGCSCSVCAAQVPSRNRQLKELLEIVESADQHAKLLEPSIVLGMLLENLESALLMLNKIV